MVPYVMPGSVIGVALVIAFSGRPFALTGTALIMMIAWVIRRMPYTIRSCTTLQLVPRDVEEAATSLGASKPKTFSGCRAHDAQRHHLRSHLELDLHRN